MAKQLFYAASTGGFYDSDIHGDVIPTDAVKITAEKHQELLALQSAGREIGWDNVAKSPVARERVITLTEAVTQKRREINDAADEAMGVITNQYPRTEIDSWHVQATEAKEYNNAVGAATPFINGLLARRPGVNKSDLVASILANADAYKTISADVFGQRQVLSEILDAAQTVEEVQAIVVNIEAPPWA